MDDLFLLLFFASVVCLIIGLIKPSVFSRFSKKEVTRKKVGLIFTLLAIVFFIAFGFTTGTEPKVTPQPDKSIQQTKTEEPKEEISTYELKAEATAVSGDTVEVKGISNLPDGSVLEVSVERISIWVGEDEERFYLGGQIGDPFTTVKNGAYSTRIKIDDRKFLEFEKASGEFIKEMRDDVQIQVSFDPSSEKQPKNVVNAVGSKGEKLENSPQKSVFGSLTDNPINHLEVELRTRLVFPYKDELPKYIP